MDGTDICLQLGDWQWNASIMGFINIVGEDNVQIKDDSISFSVDALEKFEDKYFDYFIEEYEKTLSIYQIVSFKETIEYCEHEDFENLNPDRLESINKSIRNIKRNLKSNSYKAAYKLINSEVDILALEKKLAAVRSPKDTKKFENSKLKIIEQLRENFSVLKQIIAYCESPVGKRYIGAKNVIYTIIKNAWGGVCFLNPQTREKNIYIDYYNHFVADVFDYLGADKKSFKYNCFVCDSPIGNLNNTMSFLNATGFDVARKSSHVWDFQNDIALCPVCKLVYSCLPAGIAYVYNRGLYININVDVKAAVDVNGKIRQGILDSAGGSVYSIYPTLISALQEAESDTAKYELADIQVVRYEDEAYRFNILSRKTLKLIFQCRKELSSLIRTVLVENNISIRIYDETVTRILNNQNLFTLIHRMIYHRLANPENCYFSGSRINSVLRVNQRFYEYLGGVKMGKKTDDILTNENLIKYSRSAGWKLKSKYSGAEARNKLPGICYRLLNALKTTNKDMFLDVVLNCYLYVGSPVPSVITDALVDDQIFRTMGYAFVAGMIDEGDTKENNLMKSEEDQHEK